ncbi:hypothetical protein [Egbenema bharatensis]|uniref:hypothetical protein n=1 Tax=Egbenema bharatensis TaxID=3463334 RepID=UPI003A873E63
MDTSVLNRPFDDQTQPRIALETQALRTVLQLVEAGEVELVNSAAIAYENSRNCHSPDDSGLSSVFSLQASFKQSMKGLLSEQLC